MLKRSNQKYLWGTGVLCLMFTTLSFSQEEARPPRKPELIELQLKIADKKDARPINDADVKVTWGQGEESGSVDGISNANGIARVKNVPRGRVVIRVIANGYKTVAPSFDLSKADQPLKIELEKVPPPQDPPPAPSRSTPTLRFGG
jgi:hypothetical protein